MKQFQKSSVLICLLTAFSAVAATASPTQAPAPRPQTPGYASKASAQLASHADLSSTTPAITLAEAATGNTLRENFAHSSPRSAHLWRSDGERLSFNSSPGTVATWLQLDMAPTNAVPRVGTFEFTVKMNSCKRAAAQNFLALLLGDGSTGCGLLTVGESGIYWGAGNKGQLLCGVDCTAEGPHCFTQTESCIRIVIDRNAADAGSIFHVWLDGQLIGENLRVNMPGRYQDSLLIGKLSRVHSTHATISGISLELGTPCAPAACSSGQ